MNNPRSEVPHGSAHVRGHFSIHVGASRPGPRLAAGPGPLRHRDAYFQKLLKNRHASDGVFR
jgi:hypothetical protein